MMKPYRTSRTVKSPQCCSPSRKVQSSRKFGPLRSTHLVPTRSVAGHSAESMKRSGLASPVFPFRSARSNSSKSYVFGSSQSLLSQKSHQPHFSIDRTHGLKRSGYDKKHQYFQSRSDVRVVAEDKSPIKMPLADQLGYSFVSKKKLRRDDVHFGQPTALSFPIQRSSNNRQREKSHLCLHPENHTVTSYHHGSEQKYPTSFLSDSSEKNVLMFANQRDGGKNNREQAENNREFYTDKNYGLTLDERFRTVSSDSARAEKHAQYSKEELENITVDVKRNLREYSPTVRHIMDPTEVKLVRRPGEGHRPIFDRGEIRQASRDLREDAHVEQKIYSMKMSGHYSVNQKDMENYEITRHKFDAYHGPTDPYSLTEKWHKKNEQMNIAEKDERSRDQSQYARNLQAKKYRTRSPSVDRDFRMIRNEYRSRTMYESDMLRTSYSASNDTKETTGGSDKFKNTHAWYPEMQHYPAEISLAQDKVRSGDIHDRARRETWMNERFFINEERPFTMPSRSKYNPYLDDSFKRPNGSSLRKNEARDSQRSSRAFSGRGSFRGFRSRGRISKGGGISRVFRGKNSHQGSSSTRMRGFPSRRRILSGSYAHRF